MTPKKRLEKIIELTKDEDLWKKGSFYACVSMDDVEFVISRVKKITEALEYSDELLILYETTELGQNWIRCVRECIHQALEEKK